MRKSFIVFIGVLTLSFSRQNDESSLSTTELWPKIEPFKTGYQKVSEIHNLYYELCGNPRGKPVFVLHGGPGGSCSPYMRRFFNPQKFLIMLHDQRGAGKSKPYAEIRDNTTQRLVEDIERFREQLNADKIILFGGSWGSTLALAYAETYPERVSGMVLRGIFTATKPEIDHFYHGGVIPFFPEVYDRFVNSLPDPQKRPLPDFLLSLIDHSDSTVAKMYSRIWAEYETKLSSLELPDSTVARIVDASNPYAFARLENYYMSNGCFLKEGQLLQNARLLKDIRIIIVNGRYDMICPPINAFRLKEKLPNAKLVIAESSGHWMGEKMIEKELLKAVHEFE
jgi:proline iminopeptidase